MPRNRKLFLWPAAAIVVGVLASVNPFYAPQISLRFGLAAWPVAMAVALICWVHPIAARAGVLLVGLFMAVANFFDAPPLYRGALMCGMFLALILASIPVLASSVTGFRARLALLCSWDHTRDLKHVSRHFNAGSLLRLFLAAIVFAMALDALELVPASGFWYLARWLAGGVTIFAFAEMWTAFHSFLSAWLGVITPRLMESPILSRSVNEFWTKRWNPGTSFIFRRLCFEPLARRRPALALFSAFILSAVVHALLFFMATLNWKIGLMNGLFFFVQPFVILAERKLNVHHWPRAGAGRAWTLTVLALASPLFVEPVAVVIQSFRPPDSILPATLIMLGIIIFADSLFLLAALISCSDSRSAYCLAEARGSD